MDKKPNVFPKPETITNSFPSTENERIAQFEDEKK
jgi:hypothetical protein